MLGRVIPAPRYFTEPALAELLETTEAQIADWRCRYGWPHLKIGRQVRYTEADVRAIEAMHRVEPSSPGRQTQPGRLPGQTDRSYAHQRP